MINECNLNKLFLEEGELWNNIKYLITTRVN